MIFMGFAVVLLVVDVDEMLPEHVWIGCPGRD